MRSIGKWLGRLILTLLVLGAGIWLLAPREALTRTALPERDLGDPAGVLAARETAFDDIVPGTEARILWAGAPGSRTDWVLLYLHGFSATSEEIRPVPDRVADALGANLVFARLSGHGRSGGAMAEPMAGDWVDDTALFLDIARAVGDRVLVLGTSTGGTLAAYAVTDPDMAIDLAGVVFLSPNFRPADPSARLLEWPLARLWVPWITGPERSWEPQNAAQAEFWTERYPIAAAVSLGTLLRETRARDFGSVATPALFLFAESDQVVSAAATRDVAARWGGPVSLMALDLPGEGVDASAHVIAGDILSPAMTGPVTRAILDWAAALRD